MQNGCICCTLRLDLLREIKRLCETESFDYLLIESTGIAEPMQVAETFELDPSTSLTAENGSKSLSFYAKLDTCVTVVDLFTMKKNITSIENIRNAYQEGIDEKEGDKHIGHLLIDQLEFANIIILNKCDIVSNEDIEFAKTFVTKMNPRANIICTSFGKVDPSHILNTGLFSLEEARDAPGWLQDLRNSELKQTESEEYGIVSFVYSARKPFHPERLNNWLRKYFILDDETMKTSSLTNYNYQTNILQTISNERCATMEADVGWIARSKGFVWIATRGECMTVWNHGGRLLELSPSIEWFIDTPESDWDLPKEDISKVKASFSGIYGDKRQEIVFIGIGLNVENITNTLNQCLLTDEEFQLKSSNWSRFYDPLPSWPIKPGLWRHSIKANTSLKLNIPDDIELEINLITLEASFKSSIICQVYLTDKFKDNLLCTLRSITCDQININQRLHGNTLELRTQVYQQQGLNIKAIEEYEDNINEIPIIHFFGYAGIIENHEDEEENGDEGNDGHHDRNHNHNHHNH